MCRVDAGYPAPALLWLRDGVRLAGSGAARLVLDTLNTDSGGR